MTETPAWSNQEASTGTRAECRHSSRGTRGDTGKVPKVPKVPLGDAVLGGCRVAQGGWKWLGMTPKLLSPPPPQL